MFCPNPYQVWSVCTATSRLHGPVAVAEASPSLHGFAMWHPHPIGCAGGGPRCCCKRTSATWTRLANQVRTVLQHTFSCHRAVHPIGRHNGNVDTLSTQSLLQSLCWEGKGCSWNRGCNRASKYYSKSLHLLPGQLVQHTRIRQRTIPLPPDQARTDGK